MADTTDSTSTDTQGHQGPVSFACQLHEASVPTATPGYELDFVLPKGRLEQIAAFTNKVTEDRATTHLINIEGLAPCVDLPPCVSPSTLAGKAFPGPERGSARHLSPPRGGQGRTAAPGRRRQGSDQGTRCLVGQLLTQKSLQGGFIPIPQSQGTL